MGAFLNDIKVGIRQLRKSPGFTVVAIVSLALGIGSTAAVFSVVDAVLLKGLPYAAPDQLVRLSSVRSDGRIGSVSYPLFADWCDQSTSFAHLAAYKGIEMDFISAAGPECLQGVSVSQGFFDTLGIQATIGRTFVVGDDEPRADPAVVISHDLWSRSLGEDHDVLGRTLVLDEMSYTIIGVLPKTFEFALMEDAECWIPLTDRLPRSKNTYQITGRLKPNVTLTQCRAEMKALSERLAQTYPEQTVGCAHVELLFDSITSRSRLYLFVLLGAITLVLLIAYVNVANLILARFATRSREITVRQALGAGWWRITRQMLTENLLLALLGGAGDVLIAHWLGSMMKACFLHLYIPRAAQITIDARALGFALMLSLGTGLVLGLGPVLSLKCWHLPSPRPNRGTPTSVGNRMSDALVVLEVSAALVLLIGTALMTQTLRNLTKEDPGFDTDYLLTFRVELPSSRYPDDTRRAGFCRQVTERLTSISGIDQAAMDSFMPFGRRTYNMTLTARGRPESDGRYLNSSIHKVTPTYFRTLGMPCVQGRPFTHQDGLSSAKAVVINQKMAQLVWPDQNPIGQHLMLGYNPNDDLEMTYEIVGVVADAHHDLLSEEIGPSAYFLCSALRSERNLGFMVRCDTDPLSLIPAVRSAMSELDPYLPLTELATMNQRVAQTFRRQRFSLTFLGIAGAVAIVLVIVGVYGVGSYAVSRRTQELGIRKALGARQGQIMTLTLRKGLLLAALGSALGIAGALGLTRFLSAGLYGVSSTDPMTFVVAPLLLTGVTLLACYIPARRASRIEPTEALRCE